MEYLFPTLAGGSSLIAGGSFAYVKLRPYFPATVNCWFCNTDSKVAYKSKNCFVCPNCRQYNGFTEDGDYNCDMPSQYCEALNSPPTQAKTRPPASNTPGLSLGNGLCQTCNLYQAMKVKALADFVPSQPDKFDEEVQVYERRLERLYGGLCPLCSKTLASTLIEQDTWLKPRLLNWRMQQSSTLLKSLLSPIQTGLSGRSLCLTLLLRTLCFSLTLSLVFCVLGDALGSNFFRLFSIKITPWANNSSDKLASNFSASAKPLEISETFYEWLGHTGQWGRTVLGHEAGAVLLLLALQLAAVGCAGKQHLRGCDALACLFLVLGLTVASWQKSQLLLRVMTEQHLLCLKVLVYGVSLVTVAAGLFRPRSNPQLQKTKAHRRNRSRNGALEDSQLTEGSLNASNDVLGNSLTSSPAATSSADINSLPSVCLPHPPAPLVAGKGVSSNVYTPVTGLPSNGNPFLATPSQKRVGNGLFSSNANLVTNKNNSLSQHNLCLRPSSLGETLNTSLEGLSLGADKTRPDLRNRLISRSDVIGGSPKQNGMVLRSQHAMYTQNTSGIAQASWVAGGYWGSPSKNKRLPTNQNSPPPHCPVIVNNVDAVPPSRPSSQSSGFVSHGSGSRSSAEGTALNRNVYATYADNDRASVASEPPFTWNFEACETSSQGSQNTEYRSMTSSNSTLRRRISPSMPSYSASDCHSLLTGTTTLSTASGLVLPYQDWRTRSPVDDMHNMKALSRLSHHDISDDNISFIGSKFPMNPSLYRDGGNGSTLRNPWVAFILGMSVMANGFLVLVLYKNGTLAELMR